ncbi:sensor histidine kinase [Paenibacillus camelliae]|uniref:sensor histidine kinase n=1 Tax=Paenibacillus camelliae TaxID=512410 RepID=UPI00203E7870|nr:sensor histidine kinase [Paenibacillus camelliae]MCM3634907.1 sensor histidine kinase [Paenibacillus camelliae]
MWQWAKLNTFRKQMFVVYTSMMLVILLTVGIYINVQVSELLQTNAEKHMNNTAVQSIANVELLMQQIDTFSSQVATNALVQTMMQDDYSGIEASFDQLQLLQQEVRKLEAYQVGIRAIEIYTLDHESYLPISNERLNERYSQSLITLSNLAQGKLVWTNYSERFGNSIVTIRNIRLMNQSFQHVGYLVVHVDPSLFDLSSVADMEQSENQDFLWLTDQLGNVIFTNASAAVTLPEATGDMDVVEINERSYFNVKRSIAMADWELSIMTPVTKATEGLALLRSTIIISLIVSSILFLILSFFIADRISRPILKLIRAMRGARLGGGGLKHIDETSNSIEINELNNTYNQMVDSLQALIQVVYEKEILQSQTELKALQAQINPHFLFNTLEAFYWELEENGQSELAEVIVAMSGVFRYVITKQDSDQWVTIGAELEHAERYLLIMKMRLMDRFEWEIDCADEYKTIPIPKLMIQPIIENAIEHGIERSLQRGKLSIQVSSNSAQQLVITVKDNGPGFSSEQLHRVTHELTQGSLQVGATQDKHLGVGLKNTHQRLKLSFGEKTEGLSIKSSQQGTEVSFHIPVQSRGMN